MPARSKTIPFVSLRGERLKKCMELEREFEADLAEIGESTTNYKDSLIAIVELCGNRTLALESVGLSRADAMSAVSLHLQMIL